MQTALLFRIAQYRWHDIYLAGLVGGGRIVLLARCNELSVWVTGVGGVYPFTRTISVWDP